ncbi:hypothetical protein SCG7109_AG_00220 [Chlamydiales bacterium SCGC AG-110-M15]|nr:hypothetical protein SCG7109_AG_00220 [Chlamydiales bacterium SCGC AG-110-M15]
MPTPQDLLRLAQNECQGIDDEKVKNSLKKILKDLGKYDFKLKSFGVEGTNSSVKNRVAIKDHQSALLCSIDKNFNVIRVGDHLLSTLLVDRQSVINKPLKALLTSESSKYAESLIFPEICENELVQGKEIQLMKKDGSVIDVILTAIVEKDEAGAFSGAVISLDDVSELVETKQALSHANQRYDELYHSNSVILYSIGESRRILNISNPCLEALRYRSSEVVGRDIKDFLDEKSKKLFEECIYPNCSRALEVKGVELNFISGGGKAIPFSLSARIKKNDQGEVEKVIFNLDPLFNQPNSCEVLEERHEKSELVRSSIQTPLKDSIQKLETLLMVLPEEHHKVLHGVIEHLSDDKLFRPKFTDIEQFRKIDAQISKWLISEYSTISNVETHFTPLHNKGDELNDDLGVLNSLSFNAFEYVGKQEKLIGYVVEMFKHFNLLEKFKIDEEAFKFFLHRVKTGYRNVPFHNFLHSFDITQMIFYILTKGGLASYLTDLDILALLVSVIGHDIGHTGLNGNYHEMTESPLALRYNDQSILESDHSSRLFQILAQPGCDIFKNLSPEDRKEIRATIISNILSTDMQHHFEVLTLFSNRINAIESFDPNQKEDRLLLMKISLKCADVSNAVRPFKTSSQWSKRVLDEYFLQGDLEKAAGLPVSAFMDRDTTSIPKSQTAFIEFIVKPLYGTYSLAMPGMQECMENLEDNYQRWQKALADEESK